jgi:hypothetical protein
MESRRSARQLFARLAAVALTSGIVAHANPRTASSAAVGSPVTAASDRIEPVPVVIAPDDPDTYVDVTRGVDRLARDAVLAIEARGFLADTSGTVQQCETGVKPECGNALRIRIDDRGDGSFQYLVHQPAPERCRSDRPRCFVRVRTGDRSGTTTVLFVDAMPSLGTLTVDPRSQLHDGDVVDVTAAGFPAGAIVTGRFCAPPHREGDVGCAPVGPQATATIGEDGGASLRIEVRSGRVGSDRLPCDRRSPCAISVAGEALAAHAPVAVVSFADPPGADYDAGRLIGGLALTLLLLLSAWLLVRRTDWAPVGEMAAPEIDASEYADLDAMVAEADARDAHELGPDHARA